MYGLVLILLVVGDVDAGRRADEIQDVADAGVGAEADDGHRRRRIEKRRAGPARFFAQSWIGGFGRDASMRSRIVFSSSMLLAAASRFDGSNSQRALVLDRARHRADRGPRVRGRGSMCSRDAFCVARSQRDLVFGLLGALLDRLGVVRDGSVPVATREASWPWRIRVAGGTPRDDLSPERLQWQSCVSTPALHLKAHSARAISPRIPGRTGESSSCRGRRRIP